MSFLNDTSGLLVSGGVAEFATDAEEAVDMAANVDVGPAEQLLSSHALSHCNTDLFS